MKVKVAVNSKSHKSISMTLHEVDFDDFAKSMSICKSGGKYEGYFIRGGEMEITPADLEHRNSECHVDHYHRNDASLLSADLLLLDADSSLDDPKSAPDMRVTYEILRSLKIKHFMYSTHSHKGILGNNRYRVVIPCRMEEKGQLIPTVNKIMSELREAGSELGDVKEARAWSQPWFFPTRDDAKDGKFEYYAYLNGNAYVAADSKSKKDRSGDNGSNGSGNNKNSKNKDVRNVGEEYKTRGRDVKSIIDTIRSGGEGLHFALKDFIWGMIKDGVAKKIVIETTRGMMKGSPLYKTHDERYIERYEEIERLTNGAIERLKNADENGDFSNPGERLDAMASRINSNSFVNGSREMPKYPAEFMSDWPEPWDIIWKNWKRFPNKLSEPLLIPTIIGFHGYFLNSKYLNGRHRRPNLYQLALAESTAFKDTNSKDVLRAINRMYYEDGTFNTVFDNIASGDSNITSDTAFLGTLEKSSGKFFWCNTEATRVFQMLSSTINSNVMALSDKMIEVVDGHEITGKSKAKENVQSIHDPNCQILFYAQPETIEKHINESMVDSGFLGRALITLDVDGLSKPVNWDYDMFEDVADNHCQMDDELKMFYAADPCKGDIGKRYICRLKGTNLHKARQWQQDIINPLVLRGFDGVDDRQIINKETKKIEFANKDNPDFKEKNLIGKMIRRMGNATEQLYTIVLGICREWDKISGIEPREEIDIELLFPILTFWAKSKIFVIREYVLDDDDIIVNELESMMMKMFNNQVTCIGKYRPYIKDGLIPRSILINKCRHIKALSSLNPNISPTLRLSQTLDALIRNGILGEAEIKVTQRPTKFIYFIE